MSIGFVAANPTLKYPGCQRRLRRPLIDKKRKESRKTFIDNIPEQQGSDTSVVGVKFSFRSQILMG